MTERADLAIRRWARGFLEEKPARSRGERSTDWGSLVADLSRGRDEPVFHIHDRTHVEFAIDYRLEPGGGRQTFQWEAYFFAPESLRLDRLTYEKTDIYTDLQSYVRFEVPESTLDDLPGEPLDRIEAALRAGDADQAMREMRLFACELRAAGLEMRRRIFDGLPLEGEARAAAEQHARTLLEQVSRVCRRSREVFAEGERSAEPVRTAARWVGEDISRLLEALLASVATKLAEAGAPRDLVSAVEQSAVEQARHRLRSGAGGVGRIGMSQREIEALEFRRHVLKRFTSSVLWLSSEVRPASTWILHLLYATAAGVAMAFAVAATFWNGLDASGRNLAMWALIAVVAYAIKDRIKALLQGAFSDVIERHFPDRRWLIRDRERGLVLGQMDEQAGFVAFADLPAEVLRVRRLTREHPLEEQARPETVLFHRKQVVVNADQVARADRRFVALTEIFRLDLRRWLAHTDDPKREILFADPVAGKVDHAGAPRVYNIGIIYALRRPGEREPEWKRIRVVVTRKGIRRIEPISVARRGGREAPRHSVDPPSA